MAGRRVEYVETDRRVFRCVFRRGRKVRAGRYRWRFTAEVVSGPPLDPSEADDVMARCVAELVSRGLDVVSWSAE